MIFLGNSRTVLQKILPRLLSHLAFCYLLAKLILKIPGLQ